jgi:hypothetical protein
MRDVTPKHKGTGWNTNPVDDAIERYRNTARPIRARLAYCRRAARRVGALKHREAWLARAEAVAKELQELQRVTIRGLQIEGL